MEMERIYPRDYHIRLNGRFNEILKGLSG